MLATDHPHSPETPLGGLIALHSQHTPTSLTCPVPGSLEKNYDLDCPDKTEQPSKFPYQQTGLPSLRSPQLDASI